MRNYTASYKTPIGQLLDLEFQHDFDSDNQYFDAVNRSTGMVYLNLYVGYLIYSSITESVLVPA